MNDIITKDLTKFGFVELAEAKEILTALQNGKRPKNMVDEMVLYFNRNSGKVFLGDENGTCYVLNENTIEQWHNLTDSGDEGFLKDLLENYDNYSEEDKACLDSLK